MIDTAVRCAWQTLPLFLLQSTVLILVVAAALGLARPLSAARRHFVWTATLAAVALLPFGALVRPLYTVRAPSPPATMAVLDREAAGPVRGIGMIAVPANVRTGDAVPANVRTGEVAPSPADSETRPITPTLALAQIRPATPARASAWKGFVGVASSAVMPRLLRAFPDGVVAIWLIGALIGLARMARDGIVIGRLNRCCVAASDPRLPRLLAEAREAIGARGPARLLQADLPAPVTLPATWGLLPVIAFPSDVDQWPDERLRSALLHEMAHVKRRDWIVLVLARAIRVVYWFHPLLGVPVAAMRRESERACDDIVLRAGVPATSYAGQLLEIARSTLARREGFEPALARREGFEPALAAREGYEPALAVREGYEPALAVRERYEPTLAMARMSGLEGRVRALVDGGVSRVEVSGAVAVGVCASFLVAGFLLASVRFAARAATAEKANAVAANQQPARDATWPYGVPPRHIVTPTNGVVHLPVGASMRLIGIGRDGDHGIIWWGLDGRPIPNPAIKPLPMLPSPPPGQKVVCFAWQVEYERKAAMTRYFERREPTVSWMSPNSLHATMHWFHSQYAQVGGRTRHTYFYADDFGAPDKVAVLRVADAAGSSSITHDFPYQQEPFLKRAFQSSQGKTLLTVDRNPHHLTDPRAAARGNAVLMVSDWLGDDIESQVEVVCRDPALDWLFPNSRQLYNPGSGKTTGEVINVPNKVMDKAVALRFDARPLYWAEYRDIPLAPRGR